MPRRTDIVILLLGATLVAAGGPCAAQPRAPTTIAPRLPSPEELIGGAWIRSGDLFEIEAGRTVYPLPCERQGEGGNDIARCHLAQDFAGLRGRYPQARYRFLSQTSERALGRAFGGGGPLRILHNGREIPSAALTGAARDFARQDFARLAAR